MLPFPLVVKTQTNYISVNPAVHFEVHYTHLYIIQRNTQSKYLNMPVT